MRYDLPGMGQGIGGAPLEGGSFGGGGLGISPWWLVDMWVGGFKNYLEREAHNKEARKQRTLRQLQMSPERARANVPGVRGPILRPVDMEPIPATADSYVRLTEEGHPVSQLSPEMLALLANWRGA